MGRTRRGRSRAGRGFVSADATESGVPATLPFAAVVLHAPRQASGSPGGRVRRRRAARDVLHRMLLDADGAADRFRRNAIGMDGGFRGADSARETRAVRRTARPGDGRGAGDCGCHAVDAPRLCYLPALIERFAMTTTEQSTRWYLKGNGYEFCNCAPGCGCNFHGFPTSADGSCRAMVGNHILEGSCGDVDLSGVKA